MLTIKHYKTRGTPGSELATTGVSSYGASDLGINLAAETELSIALRKACAADPELCRTLFGREQPPMIFQYNPFDTTSSRRRTRGSWS